jgi:ATP-dependent helicase HepA
VLGSERGNCSFAVWPGEGRRLLLLEAVFVLETVAQGRLHVDRFLPATPLRVVVDQGGTDRSEDGEGQWREDELRKGSPYPLLDNAVMRRDVLPAMVEAAHALVKVRAQSAVRESLEAMNRMLGHEVDRLRALQKVNSHVRPREIELTEAQQRSLAAAMEHARVRLDSVRLVLKGG